MRASWGRAAAVSAAVVMALLGLPGVASAERDFAARFSTNLQGDVTGAGNTLLSCSTSEGPVCADARAGTASGSANNNNERPMFYVDVDDNPATFNSSAATFALPAGARIVQAALYYGGRDQAGTGGQPAPNPSARNRVLVKAPGSDAYVPVTAILVDDAGSPGNARRLYAGVADVTALVKAAGAGEYTVANVQLGTGKNADQSGGWALEVFYEDPTQPSRNITVFDGFQFVTATSEGGVPITLKLDGFLTPRTGPVRSRAGLVAFEGDLGLTGDSALLNGKKLTNSTNPQDNYFNSSLSSRTGTFTTKRPNFLNQLGFDGDFLGADGYLGNNQSSTTVVLQTVGDGYAPAAVSIATDLFAPTITPTKTVDKATARLGEELSYEIGLTNSGLDAATNVTLVDLIPAGTTYVPGSLVETGGDAPGARTDLAGDDRAEYNAALRAVVFRLGNGATTDSGGRLDVNAATGVRFRVKVNDGGLADGARIVNYGTASFRSETLQQPGSVRTPDAVTVVRVPDVTILKTRNGDFEVGETTPFTLVVSNVGSVATDGRVTVTDELPGELSFVGPPGGDGWDCEVAGRELTCTRDDALAPGDAWPPIRFVARVGDDAEPGEIENTGRVRGGGETNTSNNESTVTGPLPEPTIDLVIVKRAERERFFPGERVGFSLAITNLGPSRATGVRVRDVLPPGLELVSLSSSQGTCAGASCTIGVLRRGQAETVEVVATAGLDTGGESLRDVATVRGDQRELDLLNNVDSAVVRIISLVDLVVTKVAAAPSMPAGSDIQFTVTVRNAGPSTARRVVLRDLVPAGLELVSLVPSQGTCTLPNCELGRMARDDAAQILVTARSRPDQAGQTFVNTALALPFGQLERTPADNLARASVALTAAPPPVSDIAVVKTVETTTAVVGEPLRYTLTVTNNGPDAASAVTVTESPSGAVAVVAAEPSQGTCVVGQPIRCELGPLAVGATATIAVTTVPREPGPLDNAVTAIAPGTDPDPDDNDGEAEVDVEAEPELSLTKRASRRVVFGGGRVGFTLVVRARGLSPVEDVVLCDTVPGRLAVVRERGARLRGNRACWTIGTLEPRETRRFRLITRAEPVSRVRRVTNTAEVTADGIPALRARARVRILPLPVLPCPPVAGRGASAARC